MQKGVTYALASAVLFGVSTPLAKRFVGTTHPVVLAGLLYAGSGVGLVVVLIARRIFARADRSIGMPNRVEWLWLGGAILLGGVVGPVALMYGLATTPASSASLLLNLEAVFTALLAWFLFRENFDRRIALGMLAIFAGGLALAWSPGKAGVSYGALLIAAACVAWAVDNNLTRRASAADAVVIAALKGLAGAIVNLGLAVILGRELPNAITSSGAMLVGFFGYGVSLVLFVLALRDLGSARAGAYFSIAPFFGAVVAIAVQGEAIEWQLLVAGVLMGFGVWLHLTERHLHSHAHESQDHTHSHVHDEHHEHPHDFDWDGNEPHTHRHVHAPMTHAHPHYPDIHHRHGH
jgi:drug/metabolite transporter (DMT)-like permease